MAYQLEGKLLEVCNCNVLCPCWIGENPDNGTCDSVVAYHIDKGTIDGTDVSGLTLALVAFIPENVLKGDWRVAVFVDDNRHPNSRRLCSTCGRESSEVPSLIWRNWSEKSSPC